MRPFDAEMDESYLDVEPVTGTCTPFTCLLLTWVGVSCPPTRTHAHLALTSTGKTMSARIQLQLSVGLDNQAAYSVYHKTMYPAKAMPVMYLKQHAEVRSHAVSCAERR